jgi:mannosidase alpha-like ER degradation enhancer 2
MNKNVFAAMIIVVAAISTAFSQKDVRFTMVMKDSMTEKVKQAAAHAWEGYMKYAYGYDELKPLSKTGKNWYKHSLLMTPVDAWDTFVILGLTKQANEAKELILTKLNFNCDDEIQIFEITIRQLGALITAYEMDGNKKFLQLATDLANRMLPAFKTPTGMPYRYVHLQTGAVRDSINNPAEIGTLMMEFGKLSKLTGNAVYYNIAKKALMGVYARRSKIGLVGEQINVLTGEWKSTQSHISGYIDSYYEYLYKSWKLFGDKDFKTAFDIHNAAIKKYLLYKTNNGTFMRHVDMNTGKETATLYGALDAFYAGLCAYSGDIATGAAIQKANFYMWTKYNIEPEEFNFVTGKVSSPYYVLRPENLESCFYMYRLTHKSEYLWMGKRMVTEIITHCRSDEAYTALKNVKTYEQYDDMESFFFGETLKYAYLIFAPENKLDLKKVVLNTEAHPFKISTQK